MNWWQTTILVINALASIRLSGKLKSEASRIRRHVSTLFAFSGKDSSSE